jgi:signal transduction histidine kinase/CheY-like chemotaxis protein
VTFPIISVALSREPDTVIARRRARHIAELLQFDPHDRTRIATAVSEIARNAFTYAGSGRVEFMVEGTGPQSLVIRVSDHGPGIRNVEEIISGRYHSSTGLGLGLVGARRLMDGFEIQSVPGKGATVLLRKHLPKAAPLVDRASVLAMADQLAQESPNFYGEVQQQNQELLSVLGDLRQRQDELSRLNSELAETNRGVVALYAELDERAEHLRRANQMKSRFLSHMSHEFRTPLNAIVGLTRLLLKRDEIQHSGEATRQITYIQSSAEDLTQMVNDLLDLAKAEAGKLTVHEVDFEVGSLFGGLRAVMRPLLNLELVDFHLDEGVVPALHTDESKVAQILRNFISNAIKFTEHGKISVTATYREAADVVVFAVSDTGLGIAPQDQGRIFEEFSQIDSPTQRRVKGTGLGLPLCKKLTEFLGGSIAVESELGAGSTFAVTIPRVYRRTPAKGECSAQTARRILLIDDEEVFRYLLRQLIDDSHELLEADSGATGIDRARQLRPDLIFLDLTMPAMNGFEVLEQLRADSSTMSIPVVIATAQRLTEQVKTELSSRTVAILSKESLALAEKITIDFGPPITVTHV